MFNGLRRKLYLTSIQRNTAQYSDACINGEFLDLSQQLVTAALTQDGGSIAKLVIDDGVSTDHPETRHALTIVAMSMFAASIHMAWCTKLGISQEGMHRVWVDMMQDLERQKS